MNIMKTAIQQSIDKIKYFQDSTENFAERTVVYKQHEYLLFTGRYKGSLCHSESCKCKSE